MVQRNKLKMRFGVVISYFEGNLQVIDRCKGPQIYNMPTDVHLFMKAGVWKFSYIP